jgi:CheY-like chemotaxis protein
VREARDALAAFRPAAIVLDILLRGEDTWGLLTELKRRPDAQHIPVAVVSAVDDRGKGLALGANAYCVKPIDTQTFLHTLTRLVHPESVKRILIVDDEEISRYVLRQHLSTPQHVMIEATSGADALRIARAEHPDVICLDLVMPDLDGYEVLRRLKAEAETQRIPVVIVSSKPLEERERCGPLAEATAFLPKDRVSRAAAMAAVEQALRGNQELPSS